MGVIAKQSIRGAIANYIGVIIGAVTTFFVITDLLKPEVIGLTRVMVDAAMLFAGLAQLGTNASILKFYPLFKDPESRDHGFFGWTLLLPFLGFLLIATLFFIFKDNIIDYYADNSPLIIKYAWLLLPLTFFVLYMTVFETNANVLLHIAVPKFVREVVIRLLTLVTYLLYGHDLISCDLFVILFCSSYAVATAINFFYLMTLGRISFKPDWHFVDHRLFRQILLYTLFMTAAVLAGNIKLFNSIFLAREGLALAGIYTIACYIANVIEIPYRSLGAISSPIISQAVQEGNFSEVNRLGRQVSLHQLLVASLMLFFIWINLHPLFAVIPNGSEYESGAGVVLFLGLANLLNSTLSISTNILNFSRYYTFSLIFILILTISAIVLNLVFIPRWDATGSACATLLSYLLYFALLLTFLWRRLKVSLFSGKQLHVILLTLLLFGLNAMWEWLVQPLFDGMGTGLLPILADAFTRTLLFMLVALWGLRRMHVSPEVDKILSRLPGKVR